MAATLRFFIFVGIIVWALLLIDGMRPTSVLNGMFKGERDCSRYTRTVEEEQSLAYEDRFQQFLHGCW